MQNLGPYLAGAAFWLFLGVCAVAGIVADYKRRRIGVEIVRAAIERGQPLDAALIEKLTASPHDKQQVVEPMLLRLGGVITIACGIGLCPLAYLVGVAFPIVIYPGLGLAALAVCVGIGLLLGAGVVANAQERQRPRSNAQ
jgi:hypothetical protein